MTDDIASKCEECGASVYRAHLDSGIARYEKGKLMCAHCVAEFEKAHDGETDDAFAPIAFDDDDEPGERGEKVDMSASRIHGATKATLGVSGLWNDSKFQRRPDPRNPSAIRCRTFHCKLSAAAIDFMNNQINEWMDSSPDIFIKNATSCIGPFEGKHTEQNLIITVYY